MADFSQANHFPSPDFFMGDGSPNQFDDVVRESTRIWPSSTKKFGYTVPHRL